MRTDGNLSDKTMQQEIQLLECGNRIEAGDIMETLRANDIVCREQAGSLYPLVGADDELAGISIYVLRKDYERAQRLVATLDRQRGRSSRMCPKCGSEEVSSLVRCPKLRAAVVILSIAMLLLPGVYVAIPVSAGIRSSEANVVALSMVVAGILLLVLAGRKLANWKCGSCGHRF